MALSEKFDCGGYYKKYNMDGEIKIGSGTVMVHDIFNPLPEFMKQIDVLVSDPPCTKSNLNSFYTKADKADEHKDNFNDFEKRLYFNKKNYKRNIIIKKKNKRKKKE